MLTETILELPDPQGLSGMVNDMRFGAVDIAVAAFLYKNSPSLFGALETRFPGHYQALCESVDALAKAGIVKVREPVAEETDLLGAKPPTRRKSKALVIPDGDFDAFWDAYKMKVSRGAAVRAFRTARKKADLQAIIAGLQLAFRHDRRFGTPYHPHASTWLNAEGWKDDHTAGQQTRVIHQTTGERNHDSTVEAFRRVFAAPESGD